MVIVGVWVTGIKDIFELLQFREEAVPRNTMTKDGFVFVLDSRAEDGEMPRAELVTNGALICWAAGVTVTNDVAISALKVFAWWIGAYGGGRDDVWEGWWIIVEW